MRFLFITSISVISLTVIVIINFTDMRIPMLFFSYDVNRLNELLNDFSLAIFSSYIFYLVVVYSKEYSDRKKANPYIAEQIGYLCICFEQLIDELKVQVGFEDSMPYYDQESIFNLCTKINPNSYTSQHCLISVLLMNRIRVLDSKINDVLALSHYIDPDIHIILLSIKSNSFHKGNVKGSIDYSKLEDLRIWSADVLGYSKLFQKLESKSAVILNKYIKEDFLKFDK